MSESQSDRQEDIQCARQTDRVTERQNGSMADSRGAKEPALKLEFDNNIWIIHNMTEINIWGSLTKIVTEGVRNLSGWQWKPYNSWRGVCHVLQSHLGQGTLVTTFKLLKWNVHHVRVDQTFKCPVRTTILTKFLKRRHDLDWHHYKTNCLNGMRFSEYRHWISLGALKKQIGSGWLVFLP